MFNIPHINYNKENDVYTVSGFFGTNFRNLFIRKIGLQKLDALFIKFGLTGFSFYGFYSLEVTYVFNHIISSGSTYGVNVVAIKSFLEQFEELNKEEEKTHLDLSVISKLMKYKILEHQEVAYAKYELNKNKLHYRGLLFDMGAGTGKDLDVDTLVRIPNGWKRMGDVKVGDIVINRHGKPTEVTGVYPQGMKQLYKVTFEDGRYVRAGEDHLWKVYPSFNNNAIHSNNSIAVETSDIADFLFIEGNRIYIDLFEHESMQEVELPITPYDMGVLLSLGTISKNYVWLPSNVNVDTSKIVSSAIDMTESILHEDIGYIITRHESYTGTPELYFKTLEELGLRGIRNDDKFIPDRYINSSINQRWEFIHGFLDPGIVSVEDGYILCKVLSERLANDLILLVRSLGGLGRYSDGVVYLKHPQPEKFFTCGTHIETIALLNKNKHNNLLRVVAIEKDIVNESVCISVDDIEKLYVVENYIVTHNTFTGLSIAEALYADVIIAIVPNNSLDRVWLNAFNGEIYKNEPTVFNVMVDSDYKDEHIVISNFENIDKVISIIPKLNNKKICVIVDETHNFLDIKSNRTQNLIKALDDTNSEDIILLSGTPIKSSISELAVILRMLDKRFKGSVEKRFFGLYRNPSNIFKDTLNMRYGDYSVKVTKETIDHKPIVKNVTMTLPNGADYTLPVISENLRVFFDKRLKELQNYMPKYLEIYNTLYNKAKSILLKDGVSLKTFEDYEYKFQEVIKAYERRQLQFMKDTYSYVNTFENKTISSVLNNEEKKLFKEVKTIIKYASLKVQGEALANIIGRARINCHRDMALAFNYDDILDSTDKKTIVFSSYIEVCDAVMRATKAKKYHPVGVYGDTVKHLANIVKQFTEQVFINPLVTTYKSLSESVPLIAANIIIAMDTPFRMYIYEQAVARIWRLGQDKQTYVYIPLLDTGNIPNINSRNIDIIDFFRSEVEKITGYKSEIGVLTNDDMTISTEGLPEYIPGYYHNTNVHTNKITEW